MEKLNFASSIRISILAIGLTCLTMHPANAFILGALFGAYVRVDTNSKVDVTVGLDQSTQSMINGLPEKAREQFILALQQAKPLIDSSVHDYLDQVDTVMANTLENARCAAVGVVPVSLEEILRIYPNDVKNSNETYYAKKTKFRKKTSPGELVIAYADLNGFIKRKQCKAAINTPPWEVINQVYVRSYNDYQVWRRLDGKCTNPNDCFVKLKQEMKVFIEKSDPRDLVAGNVRANERFQSIITPLNPEGNFFNRNPKVDILTYEIALGEMFSIYDEVNLVKIRRLELESNQIVNEVKTHAEIAQKFEKAYSERGNAVSTLTNAQTGLKNIKNEIEENVKSLDILLPTVSLDTSKNSIVEIKKKYNSDSEKIDKYLKDIQSAITVLITPRPRPSRPDPIDPCERDPRICVN